MKTFNILSIDGGGLRGIVPVKILQKIESVTGVPIQETFDLFAGTSTGGLIAACLSLRDEKNPNRPRYTLQQIEAIYKDKGHLIFPPQNGLNRLLHKMLNLFSPGYSAAGIDTVLREYIGEQRLNDLLRPILVSCYDLNSNQPVFFKTSEAYGDPSANASIYDVCRVTSAAPTYLPAYSFTHKDRMLTGIDGGVFVNNPAMAALAEISRYGDKDFYKKKDGTPVQYDEVRLLSLGTGGYDGKITEEEAVSWGQLQWITRITDIMMKGMSRSTDYETNEMMDPGKYLRFNITIGEEKYADMADSSEETLDYLIRETERQVTGNPAAQAKLFQFLQGLS